jgi:hypothetical protein
MVRNSYPVLRFLVLCFRVLAGLVTLSALYGFYDLIRTVTSVATTLRGVAIDAGLHVFGLKVIGIVALLAAGELILLMLDIEANTRRPISHDSTDSGERPV